MFLVLQIEIEALADYRNAVHCFLDARPHLTYLLELVSNLSESVCIRGFAAVVLGECVSYNNSTDSRKYAFAIVDLISQKIGLSSYLLKFEDMHKSFFSANVESSLTRRSFSRSSGASMADIQDVDENDLSEKKNTEHPILASILDSYFMRFLKRLEENIREHNVEVYSRSKTKVAVVPSEIEQKSGESDGKYITWLLKAFVENQHYVIHVL